MDDGQAFQAHKSLINEGLFDVSRESGDDTDYEPLDIVNVSHETDKAFLVELKSGFETWLPKSQAHIHDSGLMMFVPAWLQEKVKHDEKTNIKKKLKKPKAVCKFCGSKSVEWSDTDKGWRLFNTGKGDQHICTQEPPKNIR